MKPINRKILLDRDFLDTTWLNILSFISLSIAALVLILLVALLSDPFEIFHSYKNLYIVIPLICAFISVTVQLFIVVMMFLHGDELPPVQPIPRLADIKKYIDIDPKDEKQHKYGWTAVIIAIILIFFSVSYFSGTDWREALVKSIGLALPFHFGYLIINAVFIGFNLFQLLLRCIPFRNADKESNTDQSISHLPVWAQKLQDSKISQFRREFAQRNQLSYEVEAKYGRYLEMIQGEYRNRLWVALYISKRSIYRTTNTFVTIRLLRSTSQVFEIHNASLIHKLYYSIIKQDQLISSRVNEQQMILKVFAKAFTKNAVQQLLENRNWLDIITRQSKIRFERDTLTFQQKGAPETVEQLQHLLDNLCDLAESTEMNVLA